MEDQPAHSLHGCPVEVCHLIFSCLSRADLRTLCFVHGNLHAVAEPLLYSNIHFTWEKRSQPHPITSLLRSLLDRPQLATYVSKLSLVGGPFRNPWLRQRAPTILVSEDDLEGPVKFVTKTTISYNETWAHELRNGTMDVFVAVLVSQSLRLTSLVIEGDICWETKFLGLVLQSMICAPNTDDDDYGLRLDLRHLETVSLQGPAQDYQFYNNARNTADVLPIFYLPSLKRASVSIDNPIAFSWPTINAPCSLGLRDLKLELIREPFLGQVLSTMDQLQSLDWRWYYEEDVYDERYYTRIVDLTEITQSLSHVRETLTELAISAMHQDPPDPLPLFFQGSMKGISEFKKLTKLTVPITFLMGAWSVDWTRRIESSLPMSLESLTITDDLCYNNLFEWTGPDVYSLLERWLKSYQTSTPHLCDVKVVLNKCTKTWITIKG
ncbi:hypothetical protein PISL3812_02055 [Talaromyces islandicus]|uniref:Leucine-rich repeat domain-containing protein n=1 Tax=Talaromyces islandicus TaxID=28573 RepID=A0A0U1LNS8_TALIS|nr:hypothetical protein PISL3812_02055 [Talaromyces islandicus]